MLHILLPICLIGIPTVHCCIETSVREIKMEVGENIAFEALLYNSLKNGSKGTIKLVAQHPNIISVTSNNNTDNLEINIVGLSAGKSEVSVECSPNSKNGTEEFFILVQVHRNRILEYTSLMFGWLYFLSWSACFYPQLYQNFKAKSVVGLNFDTVMFGLFGYLMYNTFNMAMIYSPLIKRQYSLKYPRGIQPVLINDLVFSMHGVAATSGTTYQCLTYYREKQTVSRTGVTVVVLCCLSVACSAVLTFFDVLLWLDVVYLCSYIKMYGNTMLYLPQVIMNYRRRSTSGFSIMGVIIDFLGGIFCMLQIFIDGYNYDDWKTVSENPTKFGIGAMTLVVSIVFIIQHYVLYSERRSKKLHIELKPIP